MTNAKMIAIGLILVGFYWVYAAFESYARGKTGLCALEMVTAIVFVARGIFEWIKASRS